MTTDAPSRLEAEFLEFHETHPDVFDLLVDFALQTRRAGWAHYGLATIYERVRWHLDVNEDRYGGFKLNNNHRAYYARLAMEREPELAGFFATRALARERTGR